MKLGLFAPLQSPQATPEMLADLAAGRLPAEVLELTEDPEAWRNP